MKGDCSCPKNRPYHLQISAYEKNPLVNLKWWTRGLIWSAAVQDFFSDHVFSSALRASCASWGRFL